MTFNLAMGESLDRSIELTEERLKVAQETERQAGRRTRYEWWKKDQEARDQMDRELRERFGYSGEHA